MDEKELNRDIGKRFRLREYFVHKLSDDAGSFVSTSKKPFDLFAVTKDIIFYGEGKLIKGGYSSFNFNRIEDHQIKNLTDISTFKHSNIISCVYVGFWESRKIYNVLFIDIDLINYLIKNNKKSILKKELLILDESGYLNKIKKFDIDNIRSRLLTIEKWKEIMED